MVASALRRSPSARCEKFVGVTFDQQGLAADRWDDEYRTGRYVGEPPVAFVDRIGETVSASSVRRDGLYIGCGNGRNYVPLVERYGLDLVGLDISLAAIEDLGRRLPDRADRLIHGDLSALPPRRKFATVIAIQVFQHGSEDEAHRHMRAAMDVVEFGGLFCVRVNASTTQLEYPHDVIEKNEAGGYTVVYLSGPKAGLRVHFFGRPEIESLTARLKPVIPLARQRTHRKAPRQGHWDQWEGIWCRG